MEKKTFAIVCIACRLCSYFQVHSVVIVTNDPLRNILYRPMAAERLTPYAMELNEFDIEYVPRKSIKAHVLAKVLADFAKGENQEQRGT